VSLEYPTKVVFDAVTVGINEGARVGIVGRNGEGKSTLLSLLAGREQPDSGRVTTRRNLVTGLLDQGDTLDPTQTVRAAIVGDADEHVWAGDARVRDVINGLAGDIPMEYRVGDLSGGQRRRVGLASLLTTDAEVLLLDEPTNHLDIEGITWLAEHIKNRWNAKAGGLLVVTHDRWFLDEVCTTTWEVNDRRIEPFEGGYAAYILQRVERDRMAASTAAKRSNLMRKELAWLRRGPPARTSKPKFRIDAANALIANEPPARDSLQLHQMAMTRLGNDVVDLLDVSVSFGDHEVLSNLQWRIAPGERTGILGVNGAGKSTLLNLITGAVPPTSGTVRRGTTVKLATLTQQSQELDAAGADRVREVIARKRTTYSINGKEITAAQLLERLGFTSIDLSTPVKELSGGQKRRLQLLLVLLDEPNVLVMDEPSNDLDTDMLAAMEDLLDSWPGTLLVASHDRYLIERVTDQQYALIDGRLRHLPGGVEQYVKLRRDPMSAPLEAGDASKPSTTKTVNVQRQLAQKEQASIDRKLAKATLQIAQLDARIAEHDPADYNGLAAQAEIRTALQSKASELETRWLELSEALE